MLYQSKDKLERTEKNRKEQKRTEKKSQSRKKNIKTQVLAINKENKQQSQTTINRKWEELLRKC